MDYTKIKLDVRRRRRHHHPVNDPATLNAAGVDIAEQLTDAFKAVSTGDKPPAPSC